MDRDVVLVKTEKGRDELQSRRHGLARSLRPVLILVDGHSSVEQVLSKSAGLPEVERCLAELELQGYIARRGGSTDEIGALKERLAAIAEELLGNRAAKVAAKLRAAPDTREGLLKVVASCKKMVELLIDEDKAAVLEERCRAVLDA